ncbi:hypothetical protein M758_2G182000, partial [Ceratodon purpureus]
MALSVGDLLVAVAVSIVAVAAALAVVLRVVAVHECTPQEDIRPSESTQRHWNMQQPLCAERGESFNSNVCTELAASTLRKVHTQVRRVKKRALTCGDHRRLAQPSFCSIWFDSHNTHLVKK